jgi:hypothetical protein
MHAMSWPTPGDVDAGVTATVCMPLHLRASLWHAGRMRPPDSFGNLIVPFGNAMPVSVEILRVPWFGIDLLMLH